MIKKYSKPFIIGSGVLLLIILFLYMAGINRSDALVEVKKGDTFYSVAGKLSENNIIRSRGLFILLAKLTGQSRNLKTGFYQFNKTGSLFGVIGILTRGKTASRPITVKEGYNIFHIADILSRKGITSRAAFLNAVRESRVLRKFNINQSTAEGFLYPDTYHLPYGVKPVKIVEIMIENFFDKISSIYIKEIKKKYGSLEKAISLASLVEWEARTDFERPIIAGVFINRLKKNMNLQSCSTVLYTLNKHKERLLFRDLKTRSPYNTYIYKGLPPTPICNPSEKSILAVIYPARADYLYFVSMQNKMHFFASTYSRHLKAYRYFILNRRDINPFVY
jgi:UPF0755 protein